MKNSVEHLPECTQEELKVLVELITKEVKGCEMIVLYGSYARGTFVIYDERITFGSRTTFQSDLDILVVCALSPDAGYVEYVLRTKVVSKYRVILQELRSGLADSRVVKYAPAQLITENIERLNRALSEGRSFYSDIVKDGVVLYDTGNYELAEPRKLSYQEIKKIAQEEFDQSIRSAGNFLKYGGIAYEDGEYVDGSFQLHQACEKYYKAINLVFTNYRPMTHNLDDLSGLVINYSQELSTLFPLRLAPMRADHSFEERCYDLLIRAYIEARYNPDFVVLKEEYEYMLARVEVFKELTERICKERIEYYDSQIKK